MHVEGGRGRLLETSAGRSLCYWGYSQLFVFHTREKETALPPEPESSFLDGLDDRDWVVPDRPLPEVCDGWDGIVPDTGGLPLGRDALQI